MSSTPKPSRTALVRWINDTLQLNVAKVDDLGTGAVYCQLIDSIYGDMPLGKVSFDPRQPLEIEQNYKILQQAFTRHRINRNFDTQRLMKCRLQDNLDFTQWIYQFWHEQPKLADYDPIQRRQLGSKIWRPGPPRNGEVRRDSPSSRPSPNLTQTPRFTDRTPRPARGSSELHERIAELELENEDLARSVDVLMEERGLYYDKLLDIEQVVNQEMEKLYASQGENAAMDHANDPHVIMLRQIQVILFSSPEGFQSQVRPEDEPF